MKGRKRECCGNFRKKRAWYTEVTPKVRQKIESSSEKGLFSVKSRRQALQFFLNTMIVNLIETSHSFSAFPALLSAPADSDHTAKLLRNSLPFIRLSADSLLPAFLDHFSRKYFTLTKQMLRAALSRNKKSIPSPSLFRGKIV